VTAESVLIYVFRTGDVPAVVRELRDRGWSLTPEKHGSGPEHFSLALEGAIVEIYPTNRRPMCDRCAGRVAQDRPATICRECLDELVGNP
jgi:hypothetical protein